MAVAEASFTPGCPAATPPRTRADQLSKLSAKIEKALGSGGRLLVRWSGTEPKLRVMVEGEDQARITAYAKELAQAAVRDMRGLSALPTSA